MFHMVNQLIGFVDNRVFHKCIKLTIMALLVVWVFMYLHYTFFATYGVNIKLDINGCNRITFQGPVPFYQYS